MLPGSKKTGQCAATFFGKVEWSISYLVGAGIQVGRVALRTPAKISQTHGISGGLVCLAIHHAAGGIGLSQRIQADSTRIGHYLVAE